MNETLMRQWAMLRRIPRAPRKADTDQLRQGLEEDGFRTTVRTIQRDLMALSTHFPLRCDERNRPYGWSWAADSPLLDIPGMDPQAALTLKVVKEFAQHLLPPSTLAHLAPYMARADQVVEAMTDKALARWTRQVRVLPRWQRLIAPEVRPEVQEAVYRALLEHRRLRIVYRKKGKPEGEPREYEIHPLGAVFRDHLTYVVCTYTSYDDVRVIVMHRIQEAEVLPTARKQPPGFDLDAYINSGIFDIPLGDTIQLRARFDREAAAHLYETPLSEDQTLAELGDGRVELTASVADSAQLRWWLLGFGAQVEVLAPREIRKHLQRNAADLAILYRRTAGKSEVQILNSASPK